MFTDKELVVDHIVRNLDELNTCLKEDKEEVMPYKVITPDKETLDCISSLITQHLSEGNNTLTGHLDKLEEVLDYLDDSVIVSSK